MSDFEKQYYEDPSFWEGEMLTDDANMMRMKVTADMIPSEVRSVADIGCGNGVFVNFLKEYRPGLSIMAADRSHTALQFVKTDKTEADISALPFADDSFDCVCCLEVIEHLPVPVYERSLRELARISKKHIIISVPYAENLEENYNRCPQCKTIFNWDLHLRSFYEEDMQKLMSAYGYRCTETKKLNKSVWLKGHLAFRQRFYKEQFLRWNSPICPVCGYKEEKAPVTSVPVAADPIKKRKLITYFTSLPKLIWPKEERYYWIIAKYEKNK